MSKIKYIGRKNDFCGKTLWEIVGNLKNFGIGRYVVRSTFERYPEPSFMKIIKVEAVPNEEIRKVKVTVEKTFRGRTYPKLVEIFSTSYKADYRLLPKTEVAAYCNVEQKLEKKILPREIELPPLLREFIEEETGKKNPKIPLKFKTGRDNIYRIAKDGETPNVEVSMGLGQPICRKLYENSV